METGRLTRVPRWRSASGPGSASPSTPPRRSPMPLRPGSCSAAASTRRRSRSSPCWPSLGDCPRTTPADACAGDRADGVLACAAGRELRVRRTRPGGIRARVRGRRGTAAHVGLGARPRSRERGRNSAAGVRASRRRRAVRPLPARSMAARNPARPAAPLPRRARAGDARRRAVAHRARGSRRARARRQPDHRAGGLRQSRCTGSAWIRGSGTSARHDRANRSRDAPSEIRPNSSRSCGSTRSSITKAHGSDARTARRRSSSRPSAAGIPVVAHRRGRPSGPLSADARACAAYRIVQESLTNVVRHAPAAAATVEPGRARRSSSSWSPTTAPAPAPRAHPSPAPAGAACSACANAPSCSAAPHRRPAQRRRLRRRRHPARRGPPDDPRATRRRPAADPRGLPQPARGGARHRGRRRGRHGREAVGS